MATTRVGLTGALAEYPDFLPKVRIVPPLTRVGLTGALAKYPGFSPKGRAVVPLTRVGVTGSMMAYPAFGAKASSAELQWLQQVTLLMMGVGQ